MAKNGATTTEQGKGGGPRTEPGKAVATRNSTSHAITSPNPVIPGMETEQEWQAHLGGVRESLDPQGHLGRFGAAERPSGRYESRHFPL